MSLLSTVFLYPEFFVEAPTTLLRALAAVSLVGIAFSSVLFSLRRHQCMAPAILCIAAGIGLGYANIDQRVAGRFSAGLEIDRIVWVEGTLIEDGMALQGGRSRYLLKVHLCGTVSSDGTRATARGRLTVIMELSPEHVTGQRLRVGVTGLRQDEDGKWAAFQRGGLDVLGWHSGVYRLRGVLLAGISERVKRHSGGESELLVALLLGIRDDPADPMIHMFRQAGVSHVLALSGMHLGIAASLLLLIMKPIFGLRRAYLITLPVLAVYIWLVGVRPSLLRAGIMYLLWTAKVSGGRQPDKLSVLAVASVGVLAVLPYAHLSVSFQLSFLALFGIMTLGAPVSRLLARCFPRGLALPVSMSVGAQAATLPIVASQFGVFYPVGIIMTLIISPLIVLYLWTGVGFVLSSLVEGVLPGIVPLGEALHEVMAATRRLMIFSVSYAARVSGVAVGPGTAAVCVGLCATLLIMWKARELRLRYDGYTVRFAAGHQEVARDP